MKCVSYTRTMPWKNHTGELTIADQNQRIAEYLAEHKEFDLQKKYSDRKGAENASAAFDKMIDDGVGRKFDCIIVASMYYCGPGFPAARQSIKETLYETGVDLIVLEEGLDTRTASRKEVEDYFEEKRCEMHAEIMFAWRKKQGAGFRLTNSVPYGYIRRNGESNMVKDEEVAPYLSEAFSRYASGQKMGDIAKWLNEQNVEPPMRHKKRIQGKPYEGESDLWTSDNLRGLFRNPTYTGATANGSRQIIAENCHEPYMTKEQFYALPCNMQQSENKISTRKKYKKPNPLAKRIICTCGRPLYWHNAYTRDLLYDKATNKQFITVQTKTGNTFYVVIDYDAPINEEEEQYQTYFLNMVDEADLLALLDEETASSLTTCNCDTRCEAGAVNTECPVCKTNMSECTGAVPEPEEPVEDAEVETPEEPESSSPNIALIIGIIALVGIGGGAYYYIKFVRGKKQKDEDLDFFDDEGYEEEPYINEDEEPVIADDEDDEAETKETEESI